LSAFKKSSAPKQMTDMGAERNGKSRPKAARPLSGEAPVNAAIGRRAALGDSRPEAIIRTRLPHGRRYSTPGTLSRREGRVSCTRIALWCLAPSVVVGRSDGDTHTPLPVTSTRSLGVLALLATALGWGVGWLAMKITLQTWTPLFARGLAGVVAAILLAAVARCQGEGLAVPRPAVPWLALAAFTNVFA